MESSAVQYLLSYRMAVVAGLLSRSSAILYRRMFDVSLLEWRVIALLGAFQPMSLKELSNHAGLVRSQMSFLVAGLVRRGIVLRSASTRDGRSVSLRLSEPGRRLCRELVRTASERNLLFGACLSHHERQCLDRILDKLSHAAAKVIEKERTAAASMPASKRRRRTRCARADR